LIAEIEEAEKSEPGNHQGPQSPIGLTDMFNDEGRQEKDGHRLN